MCATDYLRVHHVGCTNIVAHTYVYKYKQTTLITLSTNAQCMFVITLIVITNLRIRETVSTILNLFVMK